MIVSHSVFRSICSEHSTSCSEAEVKAECSMVKCTLWSEGCNMMRRTNCLQNCPFVKMYNNNKCPEIILKPWKCLGLLKFKSKKVLEKVQCFFYENVTWRSMSSVLLSSQQSENARINGKRTNAFTDQNTNEYIISF